MEHSLLLWGLFNVFIVAMLIVDLMVFNREAHKISVKESLVWTGIWITLACVFGLGIYWFMGGPTALNYYTGYLIEKSLSVDNIFVFLLVFQYFSVPAKLQHKVLFWGIFGALVFRGLFIFGGVALLQNVHWIIYVFGGFLVFTGGKLAFEKGKEVHPERNPVIKFVRKLIPITKTFHEDHFFIKKAGKRMATPMFIVLLVIETTDIIFALDSIPAILAITRDEFIVYSSNAFAILGLRALYFALSAVMDKFHHLHYGLSLVLVFVGVKMLISEFYHIPTLWALGFIVVTLTTSILASIWFPAEHEAIDKDKLSGL